MAYSFYTVTELVPAANGTGSYASAVSPGGIAGGISLGPTSAGPSGVATMWIPLQGDPVGYVAEPIIAPDGQNDSYINDLNGEQAVGNVEPDSRSTQSLPFLFQSPGVTWIPDPSGNGQANGVSTTGIVVGTTISGLDSVGYYYDAWNGTLTQIEALPGQRKSSAAAICNNGDIVAGVSGSNGFVFRIGGEIMDLGPVLEVADVNDQGIVVGTSDAEVPVYCDSREPPAFDAVPLPQDFRTLPGEAPQGPGQFGLAYAINNSNDVVGTCHGIIVNGGDGGAAHAFISTLGSGGVDLNYLIPHDSGWSLTVAHDINDNGQIVGAGTLNGQERGFVLTPEITIVGGAPVRPGSSF